MPSKAGPSDIRRYSALVILMLLLPMAAIPQHPKHEMRAVWVATVGNIDWPSSASLDSERQKDEFKKLLDRIKEYNLNTVILQIRPSADAFYCSALEPWSQWLTGKQGIPPEPYYDPLEFATSECRKRGLDVHVWLNPYRAVTDTVNVVDSTHITRKHPEWFVIYGKTVYFDPGIPQVRDYFASVVCDVVRRYDIDAVHMDDYFYPYRIAGKEFPDQNSFASFPGGYLPEQKEEWRRQNVNLIIRQLHDSIKAVKPWVEFGISPFGVWRNNDRDPEGSATKAGQTNYDDLYADILSWEKSGWIDYVVPQLYWHIGFNLADYSILAEWWRLNSFGSRLFIGLAPYRIDRKSSVREWRSSKQIIRQIELNRTYPEISGSVFFSAKVLLRNPVKLQQKLNRKLYRYPALVPENNRITPEIPFPPKVALLSETGGFATLTWRKENGTKGFVLYRFRKGKPADTGDASSIVKVTSDTVMVIGARECIDYSYYITSISRTNAESYPVPFKKVH